MTSSTSRPYLSILNKGAVTLNPSRPAQVVAHAAFADAVDAPADDAMLPVDFAKFGRPRTLHLAFRALRAWRSANGGAFPADAAAVAAVAAWAGRKR